MAPRASPVIEISSYQLNVALWIADPKIVAISEVPGQMTLFLNVKDGCLLFLWGYDLVLGFWKRLVQ